MTVDPSTAPRAAAAEGPKPLSFYAGLPGAFVFPFRKSGWAIIVGGTIIFTAGDLAGRLAGVIIMGVGFALRLLMTAYVGAYMVSIIAEAADGSDSPPDWPSVTDAWSDIIGPLLRVVGAMLISFAPLLVYVLFGNPDSVWDLKLWLLGALGASYLPMGLIAVALYGSMGALNPITVLGGIIKTMPAYLVAAGSFFVIYAVNLGLRIAIAKGAPLGISPLGWAVSLYFLMVEMYILGRLYYTHSRRLGWFE